MNVRRGRRRAFVIAVVSLACGATATALFAFGCSAEEQAAREDASPERDDALDCTLGPGGAPRHLACTGLYASWSTKALSEGVWPFDPGLHLWSDGAEKKRWIYLPSGTQIDTSNMDEWVFPAGTKLWKEFSLGGRRIETRLLEKRADGSWLRTLYAWSEDESEATELTQGGRVASGYEIPAQSACRVCHQGRIDGVLGFEAVSLSSPAASGLTMSELVARQLVTTAPAAPITVPGNDIERAALGWLHANCGTSCHSASPGSQANFVGLYLRLEVAKLADVGATDTYRTSVNWPSYFQIEGGPVLFRVVPHDVSRSAVAIRASVRDPARHVQMPPLLTSVVDDAGVSLLRSWIDGFPDGG